VPARKRWICNVSTSEVITIVAPG